MTAAVKEFIEDTIFLVEAEEYYELFNMWYSHYAEENKSKDRDNLDELFKVFSAAEMDLYTLSENARKDIIRENMYDYMNDVLTHDTTAKQITLPEVINHLNSKLNLSLIQLNETFKDVSEEITRIHDVRKEPFKIVRN